MKPQAVLWDLDGTLADSEPLHEATLVLSLQREGIQAPPEMHSLVVGTPAADIHELFRLKWGLSAPFDEWSRFRCAHYLERAHTVRARSETVELYMELARLGVRQAVVSNSDRLIVDANLRAIGLAEPQMVSVARNDVRHGKPDPEPYQRALWLLGAEPARSVVVEDSRTGALAGLAARCRTLYWSMEGSDAPAGCDVIRHPADVRHMLGTN